MVGAANLLVVSCLALAAAAWDLDEEPPAEVAVDALVGRPAALPCDIQPRTREDRVYMVLWFRDAAGKPLYTLDARGRTMSEALHWSDPAAFGPRAGLVTASRPALLAVDAVRPADEGAYRCRVDFNNSPTRNLLVNLTVVVPPEQMAVYDGSGQPITGSVIGPIPEGSDLVLTCQVRGGRPVARVLWLVDGELAEAAAEMRGPAATSSSSRLAVGRVDRRLLGTSFECRAANTGLLPPVRRLFRLLLHLAPLAVTVRDKPRQLVAGREAELACEVTGSSPAPVVTWWLGDGPLSRAQVDETVEGDSQLLSRVRFVPRPADDGRLLRCLAENPLVPASALEDSFLLAVLYPPQVCLQLGNTLNPDNIKEGDDVYFECDVRASPLEHRIVWLHDGDAVTQNISAGVIVSTRSLVLQGVSQNSSGMYACKAVNTQGEAISNPIMLKVRFAPACESSEPQVVGMSLGETVRLHCSVVAQPAAVAFQWQCNSGGDVVHTSSEQAIDQLSYTVTSDRDYGSIACWARNTVGRQLEPCIFQLVPAVKPSPLENCTLHPVNNGSEETLEVVCLAGYDGGLTQMFVLEAYESRTMKMILNITVKNRPLFHVNLGDIQSDGAPSSHLQLYAINPKGKGEPFVLEDIAPSDAEKRTEPMGGMSNAGLYAIPLSAALVGSVLIVAITVFLAATTYTRQQHCPPHKASSQCQQKSDRPTLQASTMLDNEQYVMSYTIKSVDTTDCRPDILKPHEDENNQKMPTQVFKMNSTETINANSWQPSTNVFPSIGSPLQCKSTSPETQHLQSTLYQEYCPLENHLPKQRNLPKEYIIENSIPGPESCV